MSDPTRMGEMPDAIRIRRNVEQMRAQRASADEIEHYLRDIEGLSPGGASARTLPGIAAESSAARPKAGPTQKLGSTSWGGGSIANPLASGMMLSLADEAAGAGSALLSPSSYTSPRAFAENYRAARDEIRANQDDFRRGHPKTSMVAELAGGALTTIPTLGGTALAARGAKLGTQALAAAKAGAIAGGINGVGASEGSFTRQATGGLAGAATGAALGAALPPVFAGARGVGRGVRNVATALRSANGEGRAVEQLASALEKAGIPRAEIPQQVRTMMQGGDEADRLLNVMPETVKRLARSVRSRPGRGSEIIDASLNAQAVGDDLIPSNNERVASLTERALGQDGPVNAVEKEADLLRQAQAAAAPHYEKFRARGALPMETGPQAPAPTVATGRVVRGARGLWSSARDDSGRLRNVGDVDDTALFEEMSKLWDKRSEAVTRAQYRTADNGYGEAIQVSTGSGPVSAQAKAMRNLEDYDRILARIETELKQRGHDETAIMNGMQEAESFTKAAERSHQRNDAGLDDAFDFGANVTGPVDAPRSVTVPVAPGPDDLAQLLDRSGALRAEIGKVQGLSKYHGLPPNDARVLDAAYKRLTQRVKNLQDAGRGAEAHDLGEELSALRDAMVQRGPEYQTALDTYRSGARVRDAFAKGQQMVSAAPDVVQATARDFAAPLEADALRGGVAAAVRKRAETSKLGGDIIGKLFGTPAAARRLAAIQPDAAARETFERGIGKEAQRIADRRMIQSGSQTADKLLEEGDFNTPVLTVLQQLAAGRPGRALVTAGASAWQPLVQGRNQATREALAKILTASPTRDADELRRLLDLFARSSTQQIRRSGYGLLAAPVAGGEAGSHAGRP